MPIVFDKDQKAVYIKTERGNIYYCEGQTDEVINLAERMYQLGRQHKKEQIRKAIGV